MTTEQMVFPRRDGGVQRVVGKYVTRDETGRAVSHKIKLFVGQRKALR